MTKPCSEFPGARTKAGYGLQWNTGKLRLAHRVAYCEHNGVSIDSIEGFVVRHTCDNPPCREASHLVLGTQSCNMQDAAQRGRLATGTHHHNCKLSDADRAAIASSTESGAVLGRRYGISKTVANKIKKRGPP